MRALDASSIIYAWDNYPVEVFPPLWTWMGNEAQAGNLGMGVGAFGEVGAKAPDCAAWLQANGVIILPADNTSLLEAVQIKGYLGIVNEPHHADGVGENDIIIISACRVQGIGLVSDEKRQPQLPQNR